MINIVESQLKLRRDAVYMKTEKGIVFRSRKGAFAFSGNSIYTSFQQLLPYLDGKTRGLDLLASVRDESRRAVSSLLQALVQRDVLQLTDAEDAMLVRQAVATAFQSQIEFISHYADKPHERFLSFREKRVLLAGSGAGVLSAGAALLRNGLRSLHMSSPTGANLELLELESARLRSQGVESEITCHKADSLPDRREYDMVMYCSERPDLAEIYRFNAEAIRVGYYFLPAIVYGGNMIVGPIVDPLKQGCWECAMLHWTDNASGDASSVFWKRIALGQTGPAYAMDIAEVSAHMLGNTVAMEAFKLFIGQPGPETQSKLLKQNLSTMEASVKPIFPHHACGACRPAQSRIKGDFAEDAAKATSAEECLTKWSALLDEEFGVFRKFNDEEIEQIPLRLSVLDFYIAASEKHGRRSSSAIGWSLEHGNAARLHALTKAIQLKAFLSAPEGLRKTALMQGHRDKKRLEPGQIAGWLGVSPTGAVSESYLEFTDLQGLDTILVPAGAVHPHFDREGWFDQSSAGIGVDLDESAATGRALLSLYEHLAISQLAQGTLAVKRWRHSESAPNKTTDYLLATLRELGITDVNVVVALPRKDVYTAIVLPQPGLLCRVEDLTIATEFSLSEAINAVLCENVARAQLLRGGRNWQDTAMRHGLYDNAEFTLEIDGQIATPATETQASLEQVLADIAAEEKTVLWLDLTPLDVQVTETFRVVKVLLVSGMCQQHG